MHTELLAAATIPFVLIGLSLLMPGDDTHEGDPHPVALPGLRAANPTRLDRADPLAAAPDRHAATAALLPYIGIPVYVEGTTLHMAQGALQVADACSGFSTLYASAAVACLTAYSARSMGRRAVVLAAAAPLAIAANVLRVAVLSALVVWYGSGVLDTFIHPLSGMMTFALALPVLFWLGGDMRTEAQRVMSLRYAPAVCAILALALVPTLIHSYAGLVVGDERRTEAVGTDAGGLHLDEVRSPRERGDGVCSRRRTGASAATCRASTTCC